MTVAEKLREMGIDPIVPLADCAAAAGCSQDNLKRIAAKRPDELEIVRVSERRCGIRRSVLTRFLESRENVQKAPGKTTLKRLDRAARAGGEGPAA